MTVATVTRSEFTKFFSTSLWWVLGLVLVVYIASTAGALAFVFGAVSNGTLPGDGAPVPTEGVAPLLYSLAASVGYVIPLILGTLIVTTEFRHKTLTATFLATPRRGTVLWAKIVAGIVVGVGFGIVGALSSVGPAAGFLTVFGIDTDLGAGSTWALIARVVLALTIWVVVGIGEIAEDVVKAVTVENVDRKKISRNSSHWRVGWPMKPSKVGSPFIFGENSTVSSVGSYIWSFRNSMV